MAETEGRVLAEEETAPLTGEFGTVGAAKLVPLLLRERKFIGAVTIVVGVLALIVAFLIPNSYTATTTLMPPQQNRSIANALLSQIGAASALVFADSGVKDPNDVFIAILQSRSIADALITKYDLKSVYHKTRPEDVRSALADETHIKTSKGGLITVAVEDRNPTRAADLANSYVVELYRLNSHLAVTEAEQRRAFFEQQYKQAEEELALAQEDFKKTQQSTGIVQLDAQARGLVEGTAALQGKLAAKEVEVKAMQTYATQQNPNLEMAQQELAALREQVAKLDNHQRIGTMDLATSKLPSAGMEYATKLRNLKFKEGVLEAIGKQFEIARIDEAKDAPLIQVIDPAVPPTRRSSPNRMAILVAAVISAFVISAGWVLTREYHAARPTAWMQSRATGTHQW